VSKVQPLDDIEPKTMMEKSCMEIERKKKKDI
jgi:hypothetical protein